MATYGLKENTQLILRTIRKEPVPSLSAPTLKPKDLPTYGLKENTQLILRSIRKESAANLGDTSSASTSKDTPSRGLEGNTPLISKNQDPLSLSQRLTIRANTQLIMRSRRKDVQ